jgi:N-acetylglucosaminyldiphosphoundecaprenol N-acetyl-beta-D-mannosaminyltransferase
MHQRFFIDKTGISRTNLIETRRFIQSCIKQHRYGYLCVTNSRTLYISNHDPEYREIQNGSLLTVPDGIPLVWIARNLGYYDVDKVSGKALMDELIRSSPREGYSHYFFGSTPETLAKMKENILSQYGQVDIRGMVSPPFQPLEAYDIGKLAAEINAARPTFFWCGLGAPKQERLIAKLQPLLSETFCVGVGLAFEYYAGTVKRAPSWMHKTGMEGIYRILQQPERVNATSLKMWLSSAPFLVKSMISRKHAVA